MAFPPQFLDELRARISLADVVGRRVKLVRRGREYIGLCPFHKEKTPSFNVVEDKGFYHCFGCGAHGDIIGFTMQTGNLSFPEAVEALAQQAGLEVPRQTRADRERGERQASLHGAMEASAAFFERMLHGSEGREARLYLERRGLDEATIRRFRLGYAPERRDTLKRALGAEFPEPLLVEAGMLRRPEGGGDSFDYFRHRVMFPIGDRAGRIIAFGGRVLGDGQPKYLNSPDTPLFQKGRVLYGWSQARTAEAREPVAGGVGAIVTEGYMDVIALHRAGFATAVAPLGTALTEMQIEELWRLAPEPILCFDGDAAGQRAAGRALERALPLLKPGFSLRFATLPKGEDPDTLILRQGTEAMREVLDRAQPMAEVLWALETAHPIDTPERRAALEKRLAERVRLIAERSVQEHYRAFFRDRLFQLLRSRRSPRPPLGGAARDGGRGRRFEPPSPFPFNGRPQAEPTPLKRRQQEVLLAVVVNHPFILNEVSEELASLEFSAPDLDRLCQEILKAHALNPDLDGSALRLHLTRNGFARIVEGVLSSQVLEHARFARPDAEPEAVRSGWVDARDQFLKDHIRTQIAATERELAEDTTEEVWERFLQTMLELKAKNGSAEGGGTL